MSSISIPSQRLTLDYRLPSKQQKTELISEARALLKDSTVIDNVNLAIAKLQRAKEIVCDDDMLNVANITQLAGAYLVRNDLESTIKIYIEGLTFSFSDPNLKARIERDLIRAYLKRNLADDIVRALALCEKALANSEINNLMRAALLFERGNIKRQQIPQENLGHALENYQEALALQFDNEELRAALKKKISEIEQELKPKELKIILLNEAEALINPESSQINLSTAIEKLLKAKEIPCKSETLAVKVILRLSRAYILRNRPREKEQKSDLEIAIDILDRGVGQLLFNDNLTAKLQLELGKAYLKSKNFKLAYQHFQSGLINSHIEPELKKELEKASNEALTKQKYSLISRAIELVKADSGKDKLNAAIELLLQAKDIECDDEKTNMAGILRLGEAYTMRNLPEEMLQKSDINHAIEIYQTGLKYPIKDLNLLGRLHLDLGRVYLKLNFAEKALNQFENALLNSLDAVMRAALLRARGDAYLQLPNSPKEIKKNFQKAIQSYQAALDLKFDNEILRANIKKSLDEAFLLLS